MGKLLGLSAHGVDNLNSGFSLLELLLTLSIIALIASLSSPNFITCYHQVKTRLIIQGIIQEINLARSEAICQRQKIRYRPLLPGDWKGNRVILAEDGHAIHSFKKIPEAYSLLLRNSLGQNDCIVFTPLGFTQAQIGSFYLYAPDGVCQIIIGWSGRVYLQCDNSIAPKS